MNVYFLVEGRRTEKKVYPKWLSLLIPQLVRVNSFDGIDQNTYYIFSGNGFPSLLDNHLRNCIEDINSLRKYDYFVICLDTDGQDAEACKSEILNFMQAEGITLNVNTKLEIIIQNKCFESWFLGNVKFFKSNTENKFLKKCISYYNVKKNDPELMGKFDNFEGSVSVFHATYFQNMAAERNISYSKTNPSIVSEESFLKELIKRAEKTGHINSFKYFVDFCSKIRLKIENNIFE